MIKPNQSIQEKLNAGAQIVRKYNLGDEKYFSSLFPNIPEISIKSAWATAQSQIQNRKIVKDSISVNPATYRMLIER